MKDVTGNEMTKQELFEQLLSKSQHIQELTRQKLELLAKLEKAYAIQSLFADAEIDPFKLGTVSVGRDEGTHTVGFGCGNYFPRNRQPKPNPDAKLTVYITRFDNGKREEFLFPLADVPEVLWSDAYKQAVERQKKAANQTTQQRA
jgi:hypothetical protein